MIPRFEVVHDRVRITIRLAEPAKDGNTVAYDIPALASELDPYLLAKHLDRAFREFDTRVTILAVPRA